jgi:hypothetical protein
VSVSLAGRVMRRATQGKLYFYDLAADGAKVRKRGGRGGRKGVLRGGVGGCEGKGGMYGKGDKRVDERILASAR